ncbi:galactosylgalactosylxylosylprotein 3-beta-glucuronosyltransferase 2-like [Haliotis rufescens]|uniref:galactosylgalactosylxylosylprotein 3-beta-glucuronosyltransferase 2-like n=1 Tax=Haliotis rufescens TaxID=6454 RepID=UPI001EAF98F0|nr:galactosylgalactosylxylosylprotein 3-beta-glucuronosyltransferase 2-like [Haliotis rufescens]
MSLRRISHQATRTDIYQNTDYVYYIAARILNLSLNLETRRNSSKDLPVIYAITPTHARSQQKAELTRLSQTFLHMSSFHWIVVEDSRKKSRKSAKGVEQRNLGISWLRKNVDLETQPGVVYFADDDNTYDLRIFAEMRRTRKISVWPVGLVGDLRYEAPVVKNGKVTGWRVSYDPSRKFATDMAGFAMNLRLFFEHPDLQFSHYTRPGSQESYIISKTNITLNDLEPLADNCTKVLVWHTRALPPNLQRKIK